MGARKKRSAGTKVTKEVVATGPAEALRGKATTEFGTGARAIGELFDSVYGLHLPCLPLQYLFGIDVLPLERALSLVGKSGSGKSAMSWFLARLFLESGGLVAFVDGEKKTNFDQIRAIVDNDELMGVNVIHNEVRSLDAMLTRMTWWADEYKKVCPVQDIPLLILVDSLASVTSEEALKAMDDSGTTNSEAGFGAARRAGDITEHFRGFVPTRLAGQPICLLIVNHQKESMDQPVSSFMPKNKTEPGGAHKDFANTYIFELSRGKDTSTKSLDRVEVVLKTKKSAFSKTGRRVVVNMISDIMSDSRSVVFDWDSTLVHMLTADPKAMVVEKAAIAEVLHIRKEGQKCTSKTLGLVDVSPQEMGAAIHGNPEIMRGLQDVFKVVRQRRFDKAADGGGGSVSSRSTVQPSPVKRAGTPEVAEEGSGAAE